MGWVMEKPICRLCGKAHWFSEPHEYDVAPATILPKPAPRKKTVEDLLVRKPDGKIDANATLDAIAQLRKIKAEAAARRARWRKNHPDKHAEQQKAYRRRKKGADRI